jgi:hypothetical protein
MKMNGPDRSISESGRKRIEVGTGSWRENRDWEKILYAIIVCLIHIATGILYSEVKVLFCLSTMHWRRIVEWK